MAIVAEQQGTLGVAPVCQALAVPRATYYRWRKPTERLPAVRRVPRALPPEEREQVLALLHDDRFVDRPPAEVYATLLDEGKYVCSVRTMYRILTEQAEVKERRRQLRRPVTARVRGRLKLRRIPPPSPLRPLRGRLHPRRKRARPRRRR